MKTLKKLYEEQQPVGINGFCILKPEFTEYEDEFCTLLNTNDWKIVKKIKKTLSKDDAAKLYVSKKDESYYNSLCDYMSSGDCICCSCSKKCDDPIKDMDNLKDKVRKQWGKDDMKNAMHSSDSLENVERESKLCLEGICESMYNESMGDITPEEWYEMHPEDEEHAKTWNLGKYSLDVVKNPAISILDALQVALAEEFMAWYQYTIAAPYLFGAERNGVLELFQENAKDEFEDHASWLMDRIKQLGGTPHRIWHPSSLNNIATHKYLHIEDLSTVEMLKLMIESEIGAIDTYVAIEKLTKDVDPVTNDKIISILADEQQHKADLEKYLTDILAQ